MTTDGTKKKIMKCRTIGKSDFSFVEDTYIIYKYTTLMKTTIVGTM